MSYIREHLKGFIGITALIMCTIIFIASNELIAQLLPDAQGSFLALPLERLESNDEHCYWKQQGSRS